MTDYNERFPGGFVGQDYPEPRICPHGFDLVQLGRPCLLCASPPLPVNEWDVCAACGKLFDDEGYCEGCSYCEQCCTCPDPEDGPTERQIEAMMDAPSWAEREEMEARRRP